MKIVIDPTGKVTMVANSLVNPADFASLEKWRASHVLPWGRARRWWFVKLRKWFGETGRIADWTRNWRGPWLVDLSPSDGPIFGPFERREWAIRFEVAWLEKHRL
jgi:hypothetical protein